MIRIAHNKGKSIKVVKQCLNCNADFSTYLSREKKYCTFKCYVKSGAIQVKNDKYFSDPKQKMKFIEAVKIRSESTEWKSSPHFQKGKLHPKYKGNKRYRNFDYKLKKWTSDILKRDDYTCQHCKVRGGKLEAHHIKYWADFVELRYDVSNGIALCYDCHNKVHGKIKRKKTYHCIDCGVSKTSGRSKRCQSCGGKKRIVDFPNTNPKLLNEKINQVN